MQKVSYHLKIGSYKLTEGKQASLLEVRSHSSLNVPINSCLVKVIPAADLTIKTNDPITIELGYAEKTDLVFTGKVSKIAWQIDKIVIEGLSVVSNLAIAHFNLMYEKSSAGDIVKDLLKKTKVEIAKVEQGIKFASYNLGDLLSAYDWLKKLAQQCSFDFYANTEDKIIFAPYKPTQTHEFNYGENIISLSLEQPNSGIEKVEIYGESPASQGEGEQASSWLTKKEVKGSSGSNSDTSFSLAEPTARTQALTKQIAEGILMNQRQQQTGKLTVVGNSKVKLGDKLTISKMLLNEQNGTFKVIGVHHLLNYRQGFTTVINLQKT